MMEGKESRDDTQMTTTRGETIGEFQPAWHIEGLIELVGLLDRGILMQRPISREL
jgi:hypothetical protein